MIGRIVGFWEGWVAYLLLPALAILVGADVALRYLFNLPLQWGADVKELMLLVVVTAGLPATSFADQHIRVSFLDEHLSPRLKSGWAAMRHLFTAVVAFFISYALFDLAFDMHRYGERAEMINIPYWPLAFLVALSLALSALAELGRMAASLKAAR